MVQNIASLLGGNNKHKEDIMKYKILVIDDFYDDPESIRDRALKDSFIDGGTYPGKDTMNDNFTPEMVTKFASIVGGPIQPAYNTGNFRLSVEGNSAVRHIHFDAGTYVANVCLTHDEDCKGGLALWRHKETGIESILINETYLVAKTGMTGLQVEQEIVLAQGQDESKFEQVSLIPYKFNRLVIICGNQLHSPWPQGFGDGPENGRLTQHFFFSAF